MTSRKTVPFNDLGRISSEEASALLESIRSVVESGSYILGEQVEKFESLYANYLGCEEVVGVGNGTDAIRIALLAVGVSPGDEVATVANAGGYATSAISQIGAIPRYVDIDRDSLNMSIEALRSSFEQFGPTRSVVLTHLYGNPADAIGVGKICAEASVEMVEDCAQAAGSRIGSRMVGTFGSAAAHSFFPTKNLGAVGDAGAVSCEDPRIASRARQFRQYGWSTKYFVERHGGMNSRLDEIQAAILNSRIPKLDELNEIRVHLIERYREALSSQNCRFVFSNGGNGHLAVLACDQRESVVDHFRSHGIQTMIHYPYPDSPRHDSRQKSSLSVTREACDSVLSIPNFPALARDEVERILECVGSLK